MSFPSKPCIDLILLDILSRDLRIAVSRRKLFLFLYERRIFFIRLIFIWYNNIKYIIIIVVVVMRRKSI